MSADETRKAAFCCSGSHLTLDGSGEPGGRRDTGASLDSVGASSGSLSPLEPPSPLFPPDGSGGEGSLTSEVFLNVLKLNQNRKRQETKYGMCKPVMFKTGWRTRTLTIIFEYTAKKQFFLKKKINHAWLDFRSEFIQVNHSNNNK